MFVFLFKSFQECHTVLISANWPQDKEWVVGVGLSLSGLLRRFAEERKVCRQARVWGIIFIGIREEGTVS